MSIITKLQTSDRDVTQVSGTMLAELDDTSCELTANSLLINCGAHELTALLILVS